MDVIAYIKNVIEILSEVGGVTATIFGLIGTIFAFSKKSRDWIKTKWNAFKARKAEKKNMPSLVAKIYDNVQQMDIRLIKVEHELSPNGGGSMKDQLRLIKAETDANNWLTARPTFRTTSSGINVYVNEAYCNLCGCSSDELMKLGWKNFVEDAEQGDDFYDRWILASKSLSQFVGRLKIRSKAGEYRGEWLVRIRPLGPIESSDATDPEYMWHGVFHPYDSDAKAYAIAHGIPIL